MAVHVSNSRNGNTLLEPNLLEPKSTKFIGDKSPPGDIGVVQRDRASGYISLKAFFNVKFSWAYLISYLIAG